MNSVNYPIQSEWVDENKGLRKELVSFDSQLILKANDLSKCFLTIHSVDGLEENHDSKYLRDGNTGIEFSLTLLDAVTPIDCYIEIFLKRMVTGEQSRCYIKTKMGNSIEFTMQLLRVEFGGYLHDLTPIKTLQLAQKYKENGVEMFKKYPLFAHNYFNQAAKLLISYQPYNTLRERFEALDDSNVQQFQTLLETIQSNVAACLIRQQRYDDAVYVLNFTEQSTNVPDKAIYRRANALYLLGKLDEAKETIERINYKNNKECSTLYNNISSKLQKSNEKYRNIVKNMFR